jgi:hypothetical protein
VHNVRIVKAATCALLLLGGVTGCQEALDPLYRSQSAPAFGDFLIQIDSVSVSPNPARQGDTLVVRLFGGMRDVACVPWTISTANAGYRVDLAAWGRRRADGGNFSPCRRLSEQPIHVVVNLPGGHEYLSIMVHQPSGTLELEVPVQSRP